jgi:HK97 family phage major capsid protein
MNTAQLLKAAREQRGAALDKVKALSEKIEARTWNEATDGPALDSAKTELDTADAEVRRLETMLDIEARSAGWTSSATTEAPINVNVIQNRGDKRDDVAKRYSFRNAIMAAVGKGNLSGLEKEMHEEAQNEMRAAGIGNYGSGVLVPALIQQRDLVAGTTTTGGFTVQTDVGQLIPFLDPKGVVFRMGCTFLNGLSGNIDFPRNDGAAAAVWETEQSTADETTPTFDRVQMSPKRLAAWTEYSLQLLRQSTISVENFIRNRLMNARDNALDSAALASSTSNGPTGIPGISGVNAITVAAAPTWAKIVDFETQVAADNADGSTMAYLTTPTVAGILKTVKRDTAGNGFIWEGPNNGTGTVNGYRALTSTNVPTSGVAHYMYFGDWSQLYIGQWGGLELMADPYTRLKEATVQVVMNSWYDMAVTHGQSFAYSANVHTSQ